MHIPFCKQACHYCDFHFSTSLKKKEKMLLALQKELEMRKHELDDEVIETIYFGGGTPSLLTVEELNHLIQTIYEHYAVIEKPEITLEANPDDLSEAQIIKLSKTPINRLSIGIQSFFDEDLKMMNRAHNANHSKECLKIATQYFDNITIDLIYGVPNMSNLKWKENLQIAFDFGINHISSYALTVEPKTALEAFIKQGKYPDTSEEEALEHFNTLVAETERQGFVHYEISNFGKPNYFSKHNTSYWKGKKYLGIGPSAHSFDRNYRSWNIANNALYIKSIQEEKLPLTQEALNNDDRYNEYVMTGLRTIWGISLDWIQKEFGVAYAKHTLHIAQQFINDEKLVQKEDAICTTQKGKFLCDGIAADFFKI